RVDDFAAMIKSGGSFFETVLSLFGYLTIILLLPAYILSVVGLGFTVTSPTRNGAMGLAIASLSTAAVAALCYMILMFKLFDAGGAKGGFVLLALVLNPLAGPGM